MKHLMFCVYDEKAKAFLPPFVLPEAGMAIRVFSDCCNADDHQFGKHPSDYTLFEIGEWLDHESGGLRPYDAYRSLGNGVEFVEVERDNDTVDMFEESAGGTC